MQGTPRLPARATASLRRHSAPRWFRAGLAPASWLVALCAPWCWSATASGRGFWRVARARPWLERSGCRPGSVVRSRGCPEAALGLRAELRDSAWVDFELMRPVLRWHVEISALLAALTYARCRWFSVPQLGGRLPLDGPLRGQHSTPLTSRPRCHRRHDSERCALEACLAETVCSRLIHAACAADCLPRRAGPGIGSESRSMRCRRQQARHSSARPCCEACVPWVPESRHAKLRVIA